MTTKHTPGPWAIGRDDDLLPDHVSIDSKLHGALAQVVWRMEGDERTLRCEANARLIAASPDMLAALQAAIVDLEVVASNLSDEPNGLDPQDCAEVCAKIAADFRALVIKATKD